MGRQSLAVGAAAGALAALVAGCGGAISAASKDPGSVGVEALRSQLRAALEDHDVQAQCELFAPALLDERGGSVETCAKSLREGELPYMKSPRAYVAGGQIEFRGNEASYLIPFGEVPSEDPQEMESEPPQVVFTAVYTEGSWRLVQRVPGESATF